MNSVQRYFSSFFKGLGSLLKGMRITFIEFFTKKIRTRKKFKNIFLQVMNLWKFF